MKRESRRSFLARGSHWGTALGLGLGGTWAGWDHRLDWATPAFAQAPDTTPRSSAPNHPGRRFELGMVTYNVGCKWDLPTLLAKCRELDLRAVELRSTHRHGVEPDITAARRAEVRSLFADSSVKLFGLGSACEFHALDAQVVRNNIDLTRRFLQLAHDVGAQGVKVRPNGLHEKRGIAPAVTLKQIGHALAECGEFAERVGVEIWLEVHGHATSHPPHVKTILEHCGHPRVGVTWNSNPTDLKDHSLKEYFALLQPYLRCVHIHDLWENYPYQELFALLRQSGYSRYTMIEMAETSDPERVLRYYRRLWNELAGAVE